VPDSAGVTVVPAFAGLGAPHWRPEARGLITGLTRGVTKAHVARAVLEGIALQNQDILAAMQDDSGRKLTALKVDGGAAANDLLMQLQADILGVAISRPAIIETTALGAAFLAGLGAGIWRDKKEILETWREDRRFAPAADRTVADDLLSPCRALPPKDWTDSELLRRTLRSEARAWNELVRRFRSLIFRCVTKVLGRYDSVLSSADVDEVYGEVMMTLVRDGMRKLRLYDPRRGTKLSSWLGMIATNVAYDYLRGTARRPILDRIDGVPDIEHDAASPLDDMLSEERRGQLNTMLADYSDKDRSFVALYYAQGLDAEEVAEEMNI
jgi:RNA polymerase sigma factor (sigma-70 family)